MNIVRKIENSDKKSSIVNNILRALPEWFGIEESIVDYAKTRKFYLKSGFKPLEVFPLLWDESNPCLFMVKRIELKQ